MKTSESITEQYVVVRRDFLAHLPHLTSQAAAILLLLLTAIDQFRRNNPNQITLENDDIRLALLLQDTYSDDRNFCRLMKRKCGELYLLQIEGIPIFQWIDIQKGCVKFCITQEAMAFFKAFAGKAKSSNEKGSPTSKSGWQTFAASGAVTPGTGSKCSCAIAAAL